MHSQFSDSVCELVHSFMLNDFNKNPKVIFTGGFLSIFIGKEFCRLFFLFIPLTQLIISVKAI